MQLFNGNELILPHNGAGDELDVRRFWSEFGVDMDKDSKLLGRASQT